MIVEFAHIECIECGSEDRRCVLSLLPISNVLRSSLAESSGNTLPQTGPEDHHPQDDMEASFRAQVEFWLACQIPKSRHLPTAIRSFRRGLVAFTYE